MCNTTVIERAMFNSKPSLEAILADLHIGSLAPDASEYDTAPSSQTAQGTYAVVV
jgi:hypothetical protein